MIYSVFYYGHKVTQENKLFPIKETGPIVFVELTTKSYSAEDFCLELQRKLNLNTNLNNDYLVSFNRNTRKITISANNNFEIPVTQVNYVLTCYALCGIPNVSDLTGSNSYTFQNESGKAFYPQFELQQFVDFQNFQSAGSASINQSASGRVEVIKFGNVKKMKCNITLQTNITQLSNACIKSPIKKDPNGVENLRDFMEWAIEKSPIEFMRDENNRANFIKCILESTQASNDGIAFELIELYSRGLVGYFETGLLTFREIK